MAGPAVLARVVELVTAGHGVKAVAETLNSEGVPALRGSRDPSEPPRWTSRRVHDALQQGAVEQFDAMELRDKVEWVNRLANKASIAVSRLPVLGCELRALARSVGVGWEWSSSRPLNRREVLRIHRALREGADALRKSKQVETLRAGEDPLRAAHRSAQRAASVGWRLPRLRIRLRLLPSPALGEETSMFALYRASDEVSAIVAALGLFLWRHAERWRQCKCCDLMFPVDGKREYIDNHGDLRRQETHYKRHRDEILQKRRERRQIRRGSSVEKV